MRTGLAILSLVVTSICSASTAAFDLMAIAQLGGKGRIQDQEYQPKDPQIAAILATGKDAIPLLIKALESERPYKDSPNSFWPNMVEGDVALIVLSDLFLDPTWQRSALPELCWDNLLERKGLDVPAWDLLHAFVTVHGRVAVANRWRQVWEKEGPKVQWDHGGRFFKVEGRELMSCAPD